MNYPINPYDNYESSSFWSQSISNKPLGNIDITQELAKFTLSKNDKVMSIGSCFAQHISNFLQSKNYNYLLYEKNYTNFSAKYTSSGQDNVLIFPFFTVSKTALSTSSYP